MARRQLHGEIWSPRTAPGIIAHMTSGALGKTHIRAWRTFRGLSQEQLADAVGITTASLSRIENGKQPYNQRQLELMSGALNCEAWQLIAVDPAVENSSNVESIFSRIASKDREDARNYLRYLAEKNKA